jgi:3-methylcrotonyl-CoA carboxylase beta subunit
MRRIISTLDTSSPTYRSNREHNLGLAEQLQERLHAARYERPQRAWDRLAEQDKLPVRERLRLLLDPGSPFLELSALAAGEAYGGEAPQGLVVTGVGVINGREVLINAGDSSLKGGSWYPLSVKKMVRALDIALENRLPVIHLMDCGGAYLPLQDEIYALAGNIFHNQCLLSGAGIPQLAVVLGLCTAGGAYLPTLCDESIMVRGTSCVFLAGPPLVKAATGEEVTADELGGADMQTSVSGTGDYAVDTEEEGIALAREIVGLWQQPDKSWMDRREPEDPYYDPAELYGIIPDDIKKQFEVREVIARIVDGSLFHEFKPDYGDTMVTGWAYIWGFKVGILANNGVIYSEAANKASQFMQLCDRDGVPLIFLHNVTGFMVGKEYERNGITKDGAKMLMVQSNVTVPKLSVLIHASQAAANYAMCGPSWGPRFLFAWPNSKSSVMGSEQLAGVMEIVSREAAEKKGVPFNEEEFAGIKAFVTASIDEQAVPEFMSGMVYDDGVIDPRDTRTVLAICLSVIANLPIKGVEGGFGVFRM